MRGKKPKLEDFKKACNAKGGIISSIAAVFRVERGTVYDWCSSDVKYQEALKSSRDVFLDVAETNLQTLVKGIPNYRTEIKDGEEIKVFDGWNVPPSESAVVFVLKTIGRNRGYTERQEIDLNNNIVSKSSPEEAARFFKALNNECEE